MKQMISNQMGGDLSAQQIAVNLRLLMTVQTTLYDYMKGYGHAEIVEVAEN